MTMTGHWRAAALMLAVLLAGWLAGPAGALAAQGPGRGPAAAGTISTVAGGVGGPGKGTTVAIGGTCGVTASGGNFYASDAFGVRQVDEGTGVLSTPAGTESIGPLGDGGPATAATVIPLGGAESGHNCGLAVDHSGNLLISDAVHDRIRAVAASTGTFYGKAMTAGDIYTVAGSGKRGSAGDGAAATKAQFSSLDGLAVDQHGNLVIADHGNGRIRVVAATAGTFYGQAMTAGDIYTVAGGGSNSPGNGGPARSAKLSPAGVTVDAAGNLVIGDLLGFVRVVAASSGTFYGQAMTAGDIYAVAGTGKPGFSGDGGPATSARLGSAEGVAVDAHGNVVVADTGNHRIRVVAASTGTFYGQAMTAGDIYTVAGNGTQGSSGDGGRARQASLCDPLGGTADASGNLVIADSCSRLRVVAATTGTFYGQAMTANDIYTVAGNGSATSGFGVPATTAVLSLPQGVGVDGHGDTLIGDTLGERVRVVAASTGTFFGRAMTAGNIYVLAGDGIAGFSGDGGPGDTAEVNNPQGVAADGHGNVLIADTTNERVRVVAASTGTFYGQPMTAGDVYTVAGNGTSGYSGDGGPAASAELSDPQSVAVGAGGNLVIADSNNNRVRVVAASTGTFYGQPMTAGDIYTVAGNGASGYSGDGGPATHAELCFPEGVAVDGSGNLVIADACNDRVRVVAASTGTFYRQPMTAGDIYTVAGNGANGYSGDGGPATAAAFDAPGDVAVDGSGNLVIADFYNYRVRVVAASTGTFYGKAMTAGDIYTVAGNGAQGFSGDGGPATAAEIRTPYGVATAGQGGLLIADGDNNRIRAVTG